MTLIRLHLMLALAAGALFIAASPAAASQPIDSFAVTTSTTQAGGHPDIGATLALKDAGAPEAAKSIAVNLPEGLFGNPEAISRCSSVDFALAQCPVNAQAGTVTITANYAGKADNLLGSAPLFNVEPRADGETARFAFIVPGLNLPINLPLAVRTGSDYGLRLGAVGLSQQFPLAAVDLAIWGFPAKTAHDEFRFAKGSLAKPAGCPGQPDAGCASDNGLSPHQSSLSVEPLTDNPTLCTGKPLAVSLDVATYQDPANPSHAEAPYPAATGCEKATFNPTMLASLTAAGTDSPSGLDLQLKAPQFLSEAVAPSEIRSVRVTLPSGLTINPDAADGQSACTDAQANFASEQAASCPDNAKIGNFEIETPALAGPLPGSLYFGQPKPGDQYRVFLVADGYGIHSKLVASVHPDPRTGQLTIAMTDLPQVPFDAFNIHLFASDRGLLATPTHCTIYQADAVFTPWNDKLAPQHSLANLSLTSGPNGGQCPGQVRPFNPRLGAGTSNALAGAFSDFHLKLDRDDGDQFLGDLGFTMPPGLTASLRGVSYCPEAQIAIAAQNQGRSEQAAPSCPASAQIGTSNVAAGPGSHPFHAVGRMFMAGPFKGAPLSLVAITPALAGPYDYGVVVVRVALHVDARDAHVVAASDTVPSIIGGVPIRMRSIQVNIDKPNFMINPTNCSPFAVGSEGVGDQGTVAAFSSPFQAVNCSTLAFKPKMTITQLGSRKQTKRGQDPSLRFDLRTRPGDANLQSVAVTLPKAWGVDQRHLGNICSKAELASKHCEGRQAIGTVETTTPLLDAPLKGPAYAVSGYGRLPHIVFILGGQVTLLPEAESSSVNGGNLKTIVPIVPDAPIGHFRLTLFGGSQGYLQNTDNLCTAKTTTVVEYVAQNGKKLTQKVKPRTACGGKGKAKRKR